MVASATCSFHFDSTFSEAARFVRRTISSRFPTARDWAAGVVPLPYAKPPKTNSLSVGRTGNDRLNSFEMDGTFSKALLFVGQSDKEDDIFKVDRCNSVVVWGAPRPLAAGAHYSYVISRFSRSITLARRMRV